MTNDILANILKRYEQVMKFELALETEPTESRYSTSLVDLLRKEESHADDIDSNFMRDLTSRIDRQLAEETRRYFIRLCTQRRNKWLYLQNKLSSDFETDIRRQQQSTEGNEEQLHRALNQLTNPVDVEAYRLEEEYNRNWRIHEEFNLLEAFKSQEAKIEKDWTQHTEKLREEYRPRRSRLESAATTGAVASSAETGCSPDDSRWQHPEKQKTLIHTAPVFAPTPSSSSSQKGGAAASIDRGSAGGTSAGKGHEEQLNMRLLVYQRQKEKAVLWLRRQKVRLLAQSDGVIQERSCIASVLRTLQFSREKLRDVYLEQLQRKQHKV